MDGGAASHRKAESSEDFPRSASCLRLVNPVTICYIGAVIVGMCGPGSIDRFPLRMASLVVRLLKKTWVQRLLAVSAGLIVLFVLLNSVLLPLYVNHGNTLRVPDVTGDQLLQAEKTLEAAGLQPIEAETRADAKIPVGSVVFQNPAAESVVNHGRRVYLTVSGGEIQVIVPLLRGHSMRDAKFALERVGLRLGNTTFQPSDQYPENTIIAQSFSAELRIPRGARVDITVSSGRVVAGSTLVPNLVGKTVTEGQRILGTVGLGVGNITYQPSYELVPNTIVEQFPRAGDAALAGQKVDLFVVKAGKPEEEIALPNK
jgi:beta-lactam-binding protein with PASTA domain